MSTDQFSPIRGKCTWWREIPVEDDVWDRRLKPEERRVSCACFVEGRGWTFTAGQLPGDCPDARHCRYYVKHW